MTPQEAITAGWSVIPCAPNKKPILTTWKPYQTRQPTDTELTAWTRLNPAGWAVVTGAVSKRITLDFDGEEACLVHRGDMPHRPTSSGAPQRERRPSRTWEWTAPARR